MYLPMGENLSPYLNVSDKKGTSDNLLTTKTRISLPQEKIQMKSGKAKNYLKSS